MGVRAVRLGRRVAHRPPARGRRRGGAAPPRGRRRRSRSRSTATGGGSHATPTRARSRRCSSARRTSPAPAPSRWGSPTASTSGTPRSRRSRGSSTARPRHSRTRARRSASRWSAETSRSTTRPTRARSTRRRLSAWSASFPTPSGPAGSRLPTASGSRSAGRSHPRWPARSSRSCAATSARACPRCRSRARARRSSACATRCGQVSIGAAHDVSDGGLACALAEMAIAGGIGLEVDLDPHGRGPRLLGRDGPLRRGAGRLRDRRERARSSRPWPPPATRMCSSSDGPGRADHDRGRGGRRRPSGRRRGPGLALARRADRSAGGGSYLAADAEAREGRRQPDSLDALPAVTGKPPGFSSEMSM